MKFSTPHLDSYPQKSSSKRNDKKNVNIKWNSRLFFQISLICCLVLAYVVIQTKFKVNDKEFAKNNIDYLNEDPLWVYTLEDPIDVIKKKVVVKGTPPKIIEKVIEVVPDDTPSKKETKTEIPSENNPPVILPPKKKEPKIKTIHNVMNVEFVPIFPGCEKMTNNLEYRNCMSDKIRKFIGKKFNTNIVDDVEDKKEQRIIVQFTINDKGYVTQVKARAPNKKLEKEAIRVLSKLPKLKPGRQGNTNVAVQYMIPITFKTGY